MPGPVGALEDEVGARKARVQVALGDLERLAGRRCGERIEDRGQRRGPEVDGVAGGPGERGVRRSDQRHGLRDVADLVRDQRRLVVHDQRDHVVARDVGRRDDDDLRPVEGGVEVDARAAWRGARWTRTVTPYHAPGDGQVVREARGAGQLVRTLAPERRADVASGCSPESRRSHAHDRGWIVLRAASPRNGRMARGTAEPRPRLGTRARGIAASGRRRAVPGGPASRGSSPCPVSSSAHSPSPSCSCWPLSPRRLARGPHRSARMDRHRRARHRRHVRRRRPRHQRPDRQRGDRPGRGERARRRGQPRPGQPNVLLVPWTGGACDRRTDIAIAANGAGLAISIATTVAPGVCDAIGVEHTLRITSGQPLPPAAVTVKTAPATGG